MRIELFDTEGTELGNIEDVDEPIPRVGEVLRISQGKSAGDYLVEHIRWEAVEGRGVFLLKRVPTDTWPNPQDVPEFPEPKGGYH
jgi:hypothetical protein